MTLNNSHLKMVGYKVQVHKILKLFIGYTLKQLEIV